MPAVAQRSVGAFNAPALDYLPPIITSKIEPPPLRPTTLTRHRLLDRLPFTDGKRVTLITADPGFGKTTLLADFSSRFAGRCLWYRLDETDRDWITLVNYVIAAARTTHPDFGKTTAALLVPITGASPSKRAVTSSLMHELQALGDQPTALVLDDFQAAEPSDDVTEFVGGLLRDAPASFSFIISSRRRPALPLARWAAQDELAELTTEDLRFSASETDRLFAEAYGQPLETELLAELESRTQGWAASLQLFHSLIRGRSVSEIRSAVRSLSGATSPVYDFLAEEVLTQLPERLATFALRTSLLDAIGAEYVVAALEPGSTSPSDAEALMDEAERAGIVSRTSHGSSARQFHPLLKEFLERKLREELPASDIAAIHRRVAVAAEKVDLLTACHHYIEAGVPAEGMRCLAESVIQTMGSGRWGAASQLIDRLGNLTFDPAVVAIRARGQIEKGDLTGATALLAGLDVSALPPSVRAVVRNTRLALGWRTGNTEAMLEVLHQIRSDRETPAVLRDIAQIFIDTSALSTVRAPLPVLARRLAKMAADQRATGHPYYSAISLHNAAVACLNAGAFAQADEFAYQALEAYDGLSFNANERFSVHTLLATTSFELGKNELALDHIRLSTSDEADGDVFGELGYVLAVTGDRVRSLEFVQRAQALERIGRLDMEGRNQTVRARALLSMRTHPYAALQMLEALPSVTPLDFGYNALAAVLRGVALLLLGEEDRAAEVAIAAKREALEQGNSRGHVRLALIEALASRNSSEISAALAQASSLGHLAILEVADAIGSSLHLVTPEPAELLTSIERWPERWLPVLRRQLEAGNSPTAHAAAHLIEQYGTSEDVGRLRAFDRTYRKGKRIALGRALARRLTPTLQINDLGPGSVVLGDRRLLINHMRRKPAALLMYLVTRPNLTATREQVLEDLWPDGDPSSGANSLNQSMYFLRRELDPWYEVDVSYDYVVFEGELLSLDSGVIAVASASFLRDSRGIAPAETSTRDLLALANRYSGQFCPEFEYDDWAIAWRAQVHAAYLSIAERSIRALALRSDLIAATELAARVIAVDPAAVDVERKLVWLYAAGGSESAAAAQYEHFAAALRASDFDVPSFSELVRAPTLPT